MRCPRRQRIGWSRVGWVGGAVIAAGLTSGSAEPDVRYLRQADARLESVPIDEGAPALATFARGTAVEVHETRDGFARVTVSGWVALDALTADRPHRDHRDIEPVSGLDQATRIGMRVAARRQDVRVELWLDRGGRVVVPSDGEAPVTFSVVAFEERKIAGSTVRGRVLGRWDVTQDGERTEWTLASAAWEPRPESIRIVARVPRSRGFGLYGSAQDIALPRTDDG